MKKHLTVLEGPRLLLMLGLLILTACTSDKTQGPILCSGPEECPDGQTCYQGACRDKCLTSPECKDGQECLSGACVTPCDNDEDCPSGEECDGSYCIPKPVTDGGTDGDGGSTTCQDKDGDGYGKNCDLGPDCNDYDGSVHPGAPEICADGLDNDCDGVKDEPECTPCQRGKTKICYTGPDGTLGKGICRAGVAVCGEGGTFGECQGERLPGVEDNQPAQCDGQDNDCDGQTDEGLLNACGSCGELPVEQCGDGIDNNCNGQMDEGCSCDPNCLCDGTGTGDCICRPPEHQPCYSGPPKTLGIGLCKGGFHDCVPKEDHHEWTECAGEVVPDAECSNGFSDGLDNDCDGAADEDCLPDKDHDGFSPPDDCNDADPNINPSVQEICNGADDNCNGFADEGVKNECGSCGPVPQELCDDGLDNNCNGSVDEGCGGCSGSETRPCYRGPPETVGVGDCAWGTQSCLDGEYWSGCFGDTIPDPEICDALDNDCDNQTDERWAVGSNSCGFCEGAEICDELDNDCDGLTDEGLRSQMPCNACLPAPPETVCDGQDENCDGLIDDGLLNACGTCGESCYEDSWGGQDDWPKGQADGVSNQDSPDLLRLDKETLSPHFIWIAGTNTVCNSSNGCSTNPPCYAGEQCHTVRKLDTKPPYTLLGIYSSWGWSPSRTAVAADNTMWVGNRGCLNNLDDCDASNPKHGNAVHLEADGTLICRADVVGGQGSDDPDGRAVRAVTIDKDGNAWLGSFAQAKIFQYSGDPRDSIDNADGIPRCKLLQTVNLTDANGTSRAYGAAIDDNGRLWIATLGNGPVRKINTANGAIELSANVGYQTYGIAIDKGNNPWFGCWDKDCACGAIKVDGITGAITCVQRLLGGATGLTRGVTVDKDGYIWVAEWSKQKVSRYHPNGTHLGIYPVSANPNEDMGPLGMAVDFDNFIWAVNLTSGKATILDSFNGSIVGTVTVGPNPYSYSDMTGYQLRNVTLKHGTWILDFDSGYSSPHWDSIEWSGIMEADDRISVRARTAPTRAELSNGSNHFSNAYDADDPAKTTWRADVRADTDINKPGLSNRWIQVEVTLETADEFSPSFSGLKVIWQR